MQTLRALFVGGPMYDPLYTRLKEFEEAHNIKVEVVATLIHPELNRTIAKEFSEGTADYDLISTHTKYAPSQMQWLTPVDDVWSIDELSKFNPMTLELARINGELYGIPRNLDVKLLHYRSDIISTPPRTWEELYELAVALRKDDFYGFVFPGKESGLFGHFFELTAMAGGNLFPNPELPEPDAATDASKWAITLLKNLYTRAAPPQTPDWHYDEVAQCFREGRAAMSTDWPGGFYTYEDPKLSKIVSKYDLSMYPQGVAGRKVYSSSHTFAIPITVKDRAAAVELLRFLTSRESQAFEARFGTLPARQDSLEDAESECEPGTLQSRRWSLLEETSKFALLPPKHKNYPFVEDVIWQNIRQALVGNIDVDQALENINKEGSAAARGES